MNWEIAVCFQSLLILLLSWDVFATLYTRCDCLSGVAYKQEPLFTGTCKTLMEATTQCLKCSLCDLISKNGTRCSFHTAMDQNVTCDTVGISSGNVSKAKFRSCNCTLITDVWERSGPFYLFKPPGTYLCSEGQDVCMSHGSIMAEFYNIDELNYTLSYVTGDIFVGGHFLNGKYVWRTTNQEIDSSLWVPGQPEQFENGPCVQIWRSNGGLDDLWSLFYRPILCQKDVCMALDGIVAEFYSTDELNYALAYITENTVDQLQTCSF